MGLPVIAWLMNLGSTIPYLPDCLGPTVLKKRMITTGSDIFFRDSDYNPNSDTGKELLAHELTHVVQQGGSSELNTKKDDDCC